MPDFSWMDSASCAQTDADLFHPDGGNDNYKTAKKICARCPVEAACTAHIDRLEGDTGVHSRHGMWGARSPQKRRSQARVAEEGVTA